MRWLGPLLHLIYPPTQDPVAQALAATLDERREHIASIEASRRRLQQMAGDRLGTTLDSLIKDL